MKTGLGSGLLIDLDGTSMPSMEFSTLEAINSATQRRFPKWKQCGSKVKASTAMPCGFIPSFDYASIHLDIVPSTSTHFHPLPPNSIHFQPLAFKFQYFVETSTTSTWLLDLPFDFYLEENFHRRPQKLLFTPILYPGLNPPIRCINIVSPCQRSIDTFRILWQLPLSYSLSLSYKSTNAFISSCRHTIPRNKSIVAGNRYRCRWSPTCCWFDGPLNRVKSWKSEETTPHRNRSVWNTAGSSLTPSCCEEHPPQLLQVQQRQTAPNVGMPRQSEGGTPRRLSNSR